LPPPGPSRNATSNRRRHKCAPLRGLGHIVRHPCALPGLLERSFITLPDATNPGCFWQPQSPTTRSTRSTTLIVIFTPGARPHPSPLLIPGLSPLSFAREADQTYRHLISAPHVSFQGPISLLISHS
jgi:hypothetical protein